MRKPFSKKEDVEVDFGTSRDMVVVHHLIEAIDDMGLEFVSDLGLQDYIDPDTHGLRLNKLAKDKVDPKTAAMLGAASASMRLHDAIHNLLTPHPSLHDIKDERTRKEALDHVPYLIQHDAVDKEVKEELKKTLELK